MRGTLGNLKKNDLIYNIIYEIGSQYYIFQSASPFFVVQNSITSCPKYIVSFFFVDR